MDVVMRNYGRDSAQKPDHIDRLLEMARRSEKAIANGDVLSLAEARKRSKMVLQEIATSRQRTIGSQ